MNGVKKATRYFSIALAAFIMIGAIFSCKKAPEEKGASHAVISIGSQKITKALYTSALESYADYYKQMGLDPFTSRSELEQFRDMLTEVLVNDALTLHHIELEGFTLSEEQTKKLTESVNEEMESMKKEYMAEAEKLHESDPSKTVDEYFNILIGELSLQYTGFSMSFDEYSAEYMKESKNTMLIEEYQRSFNEKIEVSDEKTEEWYLKQLETDKAFYSAQPEKFLEAQSLYEMGSNDEDAYPPVYVPEGYSRVLDIVVYPSGEMSDEYKQTVVEMEEIAEVCSSMLFTDALSGGSEHSEQIQEQLERYRELKRRADELMGSHQLEARRKIEEAYRLLEDGADFSDVLRRYSEDVSVVGDDNNEAFQAFITNGRLIAPELDCGEGDWSKTFKDIFRMTARGEYSGVFSDEDGSLHIIMRGEDLKAGAVELSALKDDIRAIVQSESAADSWKKQLELWRADEGLFIDAEVIGTIGEDKLK